MLRQTLLQLLLACIFPLLDASSPPSNYTVPRPAGLICRIDYMDTPLNDIGVYLAAMVAIVEWSGSSEWDSALPKLPVVGLLGFKIATSYASNPGSQTPLKLSHVVLCLQQGIAHVSKHGQYKEFTVWIVIDSLNIGYVTMKQDTRLLLTSPSLDQLGAISGRLPDPNTPELELLWHYPGGFQFIWFDILSTILDAIVYVASEQQVMQHDQIYGHGITPLLELSVEKKVPLWTQRFVQKGLYLLACAYYGSKRWEPVDFKLTWRLQVFAEGYLWRRLGPGAQGTAALQQ
ncbi:MAG: hypothetical protein Q9223_001126 [Gallowayella weberi]